MQKISFRVEIHVRMVLFWGVARHFCGVISALWNDFRCKYGTRRPRRSVQKPCISCRKTPADCCSRTLEFPLQSPGALPAREQHETGPGGFADGSVCLLYHRASIPGGVAECTVCGPPSERDPKPCFYVWRPSRGKIREQKLKKKKKDVR